MLKIYHALHTSNVARQSLVIQNLSWKMSSAGAASRGGGSHVYIWTIWLKNWLRIDRIREWKFIVNLSARRYFFFFDTKFELIDWLQLNVRCFLKMSIKTGSKNLYWRRCIMFGGINPCMQPATKSYLTRMVKWIFFFFLMLRPICNWNAKNKIVRYFQVLLNSGLRSGSCSLDPAF